MKQFNNANNDSHNGNWHDAAGRFAKGNPGRIKGTVKNLMRERIKDFINNRWDEMPEWFDKLRAKDKFEVIISLMPYAVSRLQSVSVTDSEGQDLERAQIDYTKLSEGAMKEILKQTTISDDAD